MSQIWIIYVELLVWHIRIDSCSVFAGGASLGMGELTNQMGLGTQEAGLKERNCNSVSDRGGIQWQHWTV